MMLNHWKIPVMLLLMCCAYGAAAMGDPDFETTPCGQLPKWDGGAWLRLSAQDFTAEIVEDAAGAFSGQRYLRMVHPGKNSLTVAGFPRISCQIGKKYTLKGRFRGNGAVMLYFLRWDEAYKNRPWESKAALPYRTLDPGKWQELELQYAPQPGDRWMSVAFAVRGGKVEVDHLELTTADTAVPVISAPVPEVRPAQRTAQGISEVREADRIVCNFEQWRDSLPAGWQTDPWRKSDLVRKVRLGAGEPEQFGKYALFLDGKLVMTPGFDFPRDMRGRKMRVSFHARGDKGDFKVFLREGRYGKIDYLMEVFGGKTTGEWKKYSGEIALIHGYVTIAAVELNGHDIEIDNLEFKVVNHVAGETKYVIPVSGNKPVIDGKIAPGEWDFACGGSNAFQLAGGGNAAEALKRQTGFKFTSDGEYLYFLFTTPKTGRLKQDAEGRDTAPYLDDSVEMHINPTPGQAPPQAFQFVINPRGTIFDQRRLGGRQNREFVKWNSETLQVSSREEEKLWILEGKVGLKELALEPEKPFGMNLCVNRCNPTVGGTLNGGKFEDLDTMTEMTISRSLPAFQWQCNGADYGNMTVQVIQPGERSAGLELNYELDAEHATMVSKKEITTLPGRSLPVYFNLPDGAGKFGNVTLCARSDGRTLFRQSVAFSSAMEVKTVPVKPLELHILPEQKKIAVNLFPARAGYVDFSELVIDGLPGGSRKFRKEELEKFDDILIVKVPVNFVNGRNYRFRAQLFNAAGEVIATESTLFTADDSLIPRDSADNYRGVLPPHQPIVWKENTAKMALRSFTFGAGGLPAGVQSCGREVLDAPVRLTAASADGKSITGKNGTFKVLSAVPERVVFTGETLFPGFKVMLTGTLEYDGTIFYRAEIAGTADGKSEVPLIHRLSVEIPFKQLDYFQSYLDTDLRLWMCRQPAPGEYRHPSVPVWTPQSPLVPQGYRRFNLYFFPDGDGQLWSSAKVNSHTIKDGFLPYLTFGNRYYGMEFFADTDRNWVHNAKSTVHEIYRKEGREVVRTNLIAAPCRLDGSRVVEFGMTVTPAKLKTLTRSEEKRSYIGANSSCFMDRGCSGVHIKDKHLLEAQCARIAGKGEVPLLWMCKELYPQGDPAAVYLDSEWRTRPAAVWLMHHYMPAHAYGLDPRDYEAPAGCFVPSRVDFFSVNFQKIFADVPHLMGVYWDENYMKPCNNPNHADCVYKLPDGRTQGRAWWNGIREIDRRLRSIMNAAGRSSGSIALFTGEGIVPHAMAFGNVNTMGEHQTYGVDYIDYWTPHYTEIMAAGAWGIDVGLFGMFYDRKDRENVALNRAQLALVKLYDMHFMPGWLFNEKLGKSFRKIESEFNYSLPGTRFCGYFSDEGKKAVSGLPVDVKASFYVHPGKNALFFVTNLNKKAQKVSPVIDLAPWQIGSFEAIDAETGRKISLTDLEIGGHDLRVLELKMVK